MARRQVLAQAPLIVLAGLVWAAASDSYLWFYAGRAFNAEPGDLAPNWQGNGAIAAVALVAGFLVARTGARPVSIAALAALAVGCGLLGLSGSSEVYRVARHLQLAATVAALVGLMTWALRAVEPRRRGLFLAVASIGGYAGAKLVGVYGQLALAEKLGWRVYPLAFAALIASAALLAARRPGPSNLPPPGIENVFDANAPTPIAGSDVQRPFVARSIRYVLGLVCAALLSDLSMLALPMTAPPTGVVAEGVVGTAQILSLFAVALVAARVLPGRVGAACGLVLFLGCAALSCTALLGMAKPSALARPEVRIAVRILSNGAEFAFALAALRAGADDLGRSVGLVVAAMPIVWSLWELTVTLVVRAAFSPMAIDLLACAVAAVPVLVGFAGRDGDTSDLGA